MNRTAYLVAHFRIENGVPVFHGAGIYSEPANRLEYTGLAMQREWRVDVMNATGRDYADACRRLQVLAKRDPRRSWALRHLSRGYRK